MNTQFCFTHTRVAKETNSSCSHLFHEVGNESWACVWQGLQVGSACGCLERAGLGSQLCLPAGALQAVLWDLVSLSWVSQRLQGQRLSPAVLRCVRAAGAVTPSAWRGGTHSSWLMFLAWSLQMALIHPSELGFAAGSEPWGCS